MSKITHLDISFTRDECYIVKEAMEESGMHMEERTHDLGRKMYPNGRDVVDLSLSLDECNMIAESMQKSGLDKDVRTKPIAQKFIIAIMTAKVGVESGQAS